MKEFLNKHKLFWTRRHFLTGVLVGFLLLAGSLVATYYANLYTTAHASNYVTDILLDNLPVVNVDFIFNEGAWIFVALVAIVLLYEPTRIPFILKSVALFTFIRSIFMVLTHLAPPLNQSYIDTTDILHRISSGNDLFFSAHAGAPFLLALIFWDSKYLRYFFLVSSAIGGVSVILGHLHYSIDVLSALFISFGIFHIAKYVFRSDFESFKAGTGAA